MSELIRLYDYYKGESESPSVALETEEETAAYKASCEIVARKYRTLIEGEI